MNTAELIYQEARHLPEAKAREVLDFVIALRTPKGISKESPKLDTFPLQPPRQPFRENNSTLTHLPPQTTQEMLAQRKQALEEIRTLGGVGDVISDPIEWQREMRRERALPEIR